MNQEQTVLGVDIGGSSIKFCLMNSEEIVRYTTMGYENGKDPHAVVGMVNEIVQQWNVQGPIGIGFPGIVNGNRIIDAPNLGDEWSDFDLPALLMQSVNRQISIINDADAAALSMVQQTKGWEQENILCLTLGTGIGSAWLKQGQLYAGTEYGRIVHPNLNCSLEQWASVRTMNEQNLSIQTWAERLSTILEFLLDRFKPNRFILSGGITTSCDRWIALVQERISVPVEIAKYGDLSGAVGAAKLQVV